MTKQVFSRKYVKLLSMDILREALNENNAHDNKLIIHTANGIFTGKLKRNVNIEDTQLLENDDVFTCYEKVYISNLDKYLAEDSKNYDELIENPITITLEDAELRGSLTNIKLPFVEIFVDQIISFSVGSLDSAASVE